MLKRFKNSLLISGNGRNVGKTTFISEVIFLNRKKEITAVKITPHFHNPTLELKTLSRNKNWIISEETDRYSTKDTSLYLQAGASKSYFVQCKKDKLNEAFLDLETYLPKNKPVIFESAGLWEIVKPEMFIVVQSKNVENEKNMEKKLIAADLLVFSNGKLFSPSAQKIIFDSTWKLKTNI